jgi:lipid-A-disaccharide synthase
LLDALEETDAEADPIGFRKKNNLDGRPLIALLPGSRKQEVIRVLPIMRRITGYFPEYQFVVAGLSSLPDDLYTGILSHSNIRIVMDETYGLLHHATAALVTSGTATLETALLDVPEVICYKGGSLSYQIARRLVKVPFIGLVNLIMQKEIVRELIQHNLNETNLRRELVRILPGGPDHKQIKMDYADLKKVLGGKGASERTARLLLARLQ